MKHKVKSNKIVASAVLAIGMLSAPLANALPVVFFGEDAGLGENIVLPQAQRFNSTAASNNFLGSLINPGIETFESIPAGITAPLPITFAGAGVTATITGISGQVVALPNGATNGFGRYGVTDDGGIDERYWDTGGGANSFSINFSAPVAAFGFWGIDIGDFAGQVTATTAGGLNQVFNVGNTPNIAGGSVLFWGVIDPLQTFTSVAFGNTGSGADVFGFDDFTVGTLEQVNIPEPSLLALIGLGLAGLNLRYRRS